MCHRYMLLNYMYLQKVKILLLFYNLYWIEHIVLHPSYVIRRSMKRKDVIHLTCHERQLHDGTGLKLLRFIL